MAEIVNCPFCGGIATVGGLVPWVECQSCGASGPQKTTEAEAITAWNTRHGAGDAEDAARYRWLKARSWGGSGAYYFKGPPYREGMTLDAAIDAARAGERGDS